MQVIRHTFLITNAALLGEKLAENLILSGLDSLKVSFYGSILLLSDRHTAYHCQKAGTVCTCQGSNALLADGARALVSIDDFVTAVAGEVVGHEVSIRLPEGTEGAILRVLGQEPAEAAVLAREANVDVARTLAALSTLEVTGWVEQLPGMRFRRAG